MSLCICISTFAEIRMPKIFSDFMVLQRGEPVKIWGLSAPNAKIKVVFNGIERTADASKNGRWALTLDKMPACNTPREMSVYENGKKEKIIKNILVGEVWVVGGQSNMQFRVGNSNDANNAIKRAKKLSTLRCFMQDSQAIAKTPQFDSPQGARWQNAHLANIEAWSAVGFYFGEHINKLLDVPVGLIHTPLGATPMVAWLDESAVKKNPYTKKCWEEFKKLAESYDSAAYQKALSEFNGLRKNLAAENSKRKAKGLPTKKLPWDKREPNAISPVQNFKSPVYNYNAKIAPLAGYGVRGTIWYQGESDSFEPSVSHFETQCKLLISEWRRYFNSCAMPFIMAQISSYKHTKGNWPKARKAQFETAKTMNNVYIVPTIDKGESLDIHPHDKTSVGIRMAKIALLQVYGNKSEKSFAPNLKSVKYSGNTAEVFIENYGSNIILKGIERGFEVLVGNKWIVAKAKLMNNKIIVRSDDETEIRGIRYLWSNCPLDDICIFNDAGLPMFPFDDEK